MDKAVRFALPYQRHMTNYKLKNVKRKHYGEKLQFVIIAKKLSVIANTVNSSKHIKKKERKMTKKIFTAIAVIAIAVCAYFAHDYYRESLKTAAFKQAVAFTNGGEVFKGESFNQNILRLRSHKRRVELVISGQYPWRKEIDRLNEGDYIYLVFSGFRAYDTDPTDFTNFLEPYVHKAR
jgi:hypothetical protein